MVSTPREGARVGTLRRPESVCDFSARVSPWLDIYVELLSSQILC